MNEQEITLKRLQELALRAKYASAPAFTRFLEPSLERAVLTAAAHAEVRAAFFGGYEGAERRIAAFWAEDAPAEQDYPLCCLELKWNPKYASPGHRDLLGAVMGLGLERSATGDICMGSDEGTAYLFAHCDVESYIAMNLEAAGRASLKIRAAQLPPKLKEPEGIALRVTVSSVRLDSVIAAALKLSRSEAQRLIEGALVKRNHIEELRGDVHLEEGDLLSVRGHGRLRVEGFDGTTRKGRQAVRLFRYTG